MADFSSLKQTIQTYIKQNGNEEITGNILQDVLLAMVSTMGDSAINGLVSALQDEITARQNQYGTLQGNITAESTARQQADTALGGRIDGLQTAINGINTKLAEGYIYAGIATPSTNPGTSSGKVFYIAVSSGTYTNFSNLTVAQGINILKYNGSAWSKDVVYAIDARPKKNSQNLVTSGGVFDNMGALDVSELNATENPHTLARYADLSAALAAIPTDYQKGGMSIKFVQSSDNKYVQARCMADSFTTDVTQWQGVDEESTAGSDNLVKSGGVDALKSNLLSAYISYSQKGALKNTGDVNSSVGWITYYKIPIVAGDKFYRNSTVPSLEGYVAVVLYNTQGNVIETINTNIIDITIESDGYLSFCYSTKQSPVIRLWSFKGIGNCVLTKTELSPLSLISFDTENPVIIIDYQEQKVKIDNTRIILSDGRNILYDAGSSVTYETNFIGQPLSEKTPNFLYLNNADKKIYLRKYNGNFPQEFDFNGNALAYLLGIIVRTGNKYSIGFNYSSIRIIRANGEEVNIRRDYDKIHASDVDFINITRLRNLFNKETIVQGYYSTDGVTFTQSDTLWTSDFISVESGKTYSKSNINTMYYVYAYNTDKIPVVVNETKVYWQLGTVTIPEGVAYIRVIFSSVKIDVAMIYDNDNPPSGYEPYHIATLAPDIKILPESLPDLYKETIYGSSNIGNLIYQEIGDTDYSQIIMYGQSLSMGWQSPEPIVEDAIPGVFMVGDKVAVNHGNSGETVLNPLISTRATNCGENPTVGAMNAFAKLYKRFVNNEQKFIATSCGEGGKSIELLSKECTNATNLNIYNKEFLRALNRTKTTVDAVDKTVGCFAIIYMQGENNYVGLEGAGLEPNTDATNNKDEYKQLLLTLKNNMQNDIMSIYGQSHKPLFFIYEVAGKYINNLDMSINMAQIEFAQENDDVFLLSPTYPVPDYAGGHLSTNGYRWYGEMIAKSLYNVFIKGSAFHPIMPRNFTIVNKNYIQIDFYVPVLPLVFDNYTKEEITDYGFQLFVDNSSTTISSISIKNNAVIIESPINLMNKKVEIVYAGNNRSGSGNLRDSDTYHSLYNYYDDRVSSPDLRENYTPKDKNGNYIYGKPYPMYNWCGNFYKLVQSI